jgi:long-chain acyl-CoA synthetase
MTTPSTLCEAFQGNVERLGDRIALRTTGGGLQITWRQYGERVHSIATGLATLGVRPGDTVALMMTNRPEFHLCNTAILHAGGTPFSMYKTNPPAMLAYLFENSECRTVVCEKQFAPQILAASQLGGKVENVICVDGTPTGTLALADVAALSANGFDFEATWRSVEPGDTSTIVYTSGTTGMPKGVELSHTNLLSTAPLFDTLGGIGPDDRVVSYLPDAHAANRCFAHYANLVSGMQVTTVADPKKVIDALTDLRPTVFVGVPRIWMKVKAVLEQSVADEPHPLKRRLATWALDVGQERARRNSEHDRVPLGLQLQCAIADTLVLSKVRAKLGLDLVRLGASGAAPIPPEVHQFMLGLGIPVCEAWGMSELSSVGTVNPPNDIRIGTVGKPVPGAQLMVAQDGELLVRGPMVMKGYRRDSKKTAETIDSEGWLHTGDIGSIDDDGYVKIVDRKKELIINSYDKNMSPSHIENTVNVACALAGPVMAIGDRRPYIVALVTLDPDAVEAFAKTEGPDNIPMSRWCAHPAVVAEVAAGIARANSKLARVEQIKSYQILPDVWEPGSENVTPTMKLKRKAIAATYAREIEALYEQHVTAD